jgi:putative membrane protein
VDCAVDALALLRVIRFALAVLLLWPAAAFAHHVEAGHSWNLEPWLLACLAVSAVLYALGLARLWRRAGAGRGITRTRAASFAGGWLALVVALVSPLDAYGEKLFSAHMVQHEILMVVAAPLLVLGRPVEAWTWAMAPPWRSALGRAAHAGWLMGLWTAISEPWAAWLLHAFALWVWHVPVLFEAALDMESVHVAQHASFLGTALLFWWSVLGHGVRRPDGAALASLFTTMIHTGALGALLTFSGRAWYPSYAATSGAFGLTALEDLQLGGLVMWVPAGFAYVVAGLAIAARHLATPRVRTAAAPSPR